MRINDIGVIGDTGGQLLGISVVQLTLHFRFYSFLDHLVRRVFQAFNNHLFRSDFQFDLSQNL